MLDSKRSKGKLWTQQSKVLPTPSTAVEVPRQYRFKTVLFFGRNGLLTSRSGLSRMTELAFAILRTIVRLGEAVPDIPIASAVDFILPVNCRRSTTAVRAASGTAGKMNSSEAEPRMPPRPKLQNMCGPAPMTLKESGAERRARSAPQRKF